MSRVAVLLATVAAALVAPGGASATERADYPVCCASPGCCFDAIDYGLGVAATRQTLDEVRRLKAFRLRVTIDKDKQGATCYLTVSLGPRVARSIGLNPLHDYALDLVPAPGEQVVISSVRAEVSNGSLVDLPIPKRVRRALGRVQDRIRVRFDGEGGSDHPVARHVYGY